MSIQLSHNEMNHLHSILSPPLEHVVQLWSVVWMVKDTLQLRFHDKIVFLIFDQRDLGTFRNVTVFTVYIQVSFHLHEISFVSCQRKEFILPLTKLTTSNIAEYGRAALNSGWLRNDFEPL
jgi:hypothetical protein